MVPSPRFVAGWMVWWSLRVAVVAVVVAAVAGCAGAPTRPTRPGVDDFVRLERTECLETCPVYTVTVYADGAVRYEGGRDARPGVHWRAIDPSEVARIVDDVRRVPAWTLDLACHSTDYPHGIVTLSWHGQVRRIDHDHGDACAPEAIGWVESEIDVAGGHPQGWM